MNEVPHPGFEKPEEYETFTTTNGLEEAAEKSSTQYYQDAGYSPFPNVETAAHKSGFIAGAKWQAEQFEKNRLTACSNQTREEYDRETDFALGIIKKEHRQPTFSDAINYGMRLQKEQDMDEWLKDRDGCFWDGVEEGKKAMREQMMKEAVEGFVATHLTSEGTKVTVNSGYLPKEMCIKPDDKVRIIIVKEG